MTALMTAKINQQDKDETDLARHAIADIDAFAELYHRHIARVYRYHVAHTGNVKDAEDLTSQTFIAALEGIRSFRGMGSFAAWIMGIASKKRLMFFGGLSNAEAGRVLNKSEAAVKMLVSRGLQDLRERTSLVLEVE